MSAAANEREDAATKNNKDPRRRSPGNNENRSRLGTLPQFQLKLIMWNPAIYMGANADNPQRQYEYSLALWKPNQFNRMQDVWILLMTAESPSPFSFPSMDSAQSNLAACLQDMARRMVNGQSRTQP